MKETQRKKICAGVNSYIEAQQYCYVDKSLFIRDLLTEDGLPKGGFAMLILVPESAARVSIWTCSGPFLKRLRRTIQGISRIRKSGSARTA
ncbi:MAG: hypothetical protein LUE27_07750 [Clostridia bacterium]|nr:hypothetical protein [Clostridia bacterium]